MQLPDGWGVGLAQLQGGPQLYFWPSALAEQRWTTWRSPLEAPQLVHVIALEGHQRIERGDGVFHTDHGVARARPLPHGGRTITPQG